MNGREVFKQAVRRFPEVIRECLDYNNLKVEDIKLFLPHQANIRINKMVQKSLGLQDNQVLNNIDKYGNTTSATIPILLTEAYQKNLIEKGDFILMAAFGSGLFGELQLFNGK
jgi:3-oxoacyl-[acyl-carrier-protein] synthase-3